MEELFNLGEPQTPFEAFPAPKATDNSEGIKEVVVALRAARTETEIEEIRKIVNSLGPDFTKTSSQQGVAQGIEVESDQRFSEAAEQGDLGELFEIELERALRREDVQSDEAPEASDLLQFSAGALYDRATQVGMSRMIGTMKRIDQKMEDTSVSVLGIVGDILDLIVSAPLDGLTLAGFGRVDKVEFLRNQMSNQTISNEEYYSLLDDTIEELEDAGWFTENNYLHLAGGISNIAEGALGTTATLEKVGAALDLGFGISSGLRLGLKTVPKVLAGRLRNTTRIAGLIGSPEDAAKVLRDGAAKPGSVEAIAAGVVEETTPGLARMLSDSGDTSMVAPGARIAAETEQKNRILNIIKDLGFSKNIDPEVLANAVPTALRRLNESLATKVRHSVRNLEIIEDKSNNVFGVISLGKADGSGAFKDLNAAKRVAVKNGAIPKLFDEGGDIKPTVLGGKTTYEVVLTKNIPTKELTKTLTLGDIGKYGVNGIAIPFARAFGGNFLALPESLTALALRGEGVMSLAAKKIGSIVNEKIKAVKPGEVDRVNAIFYAMRDGERFAHARRAMTIPEFRSEWARVPGAGVPSAAAEDLYLTIQELNNALYFLKADKIFKQVVDEGSEVLTYSTVRRSGEVDDIATIVRKVDKDKIPDSERVLNVVTGELSVPSKLGKGTQVFRTAEGVERNGAVSLYITTENPSLRRVYHSDVLGYNAGGPRNYVNLRFFVKQATEVLLSNGTSVTGKARTFLGVTTRKEALFAAGEINATFNGLKGMVPGLKDMTRAAAIDAISGLRNNAAANSLVKTHAAWNNSIDSVDKLVDFMRNQKMDPRIEMSIAAKDDAIATVDDSGRAIFGAKEGETYGESFELSLNLPRNNGPRRDEPLLGLGGDFADTISPLDAIQNDFLRSIHSKASEAFGFQSINGWLQGAKHLITPAGKKVLDGLSPLEQLRKAGPELFGKNLGPEATAFLDVRDAILRTLSTKTEYDLKWNSMVNRLGEYVFDKGWKKSGEFLFNNQAAQSPLTFLRGLTFDARLGMLDPAQLIVQSAQVSNIIAIAGLNPLKGMRAAATHAPLRMAMRAIDKEADATAILKELGRRTSAFTGIDADDFVRLAQWTHRSGRLNVGDEIAEIGGLSDTLAKGYYRKARDLSRVFFNEGEKVPRSAAIAVAWREFGEQFPKLDAFDEFGTKWITSRQNALTAGMTRANAAAWQRGPMSVPLQFMTYSSRMLESLFTDRLLTKAERIRLATAQIAFWGAAGTGTGAVLDAYILESGWQIDETQYTLLRYGALDAFLNATLGTQAVFGGRLAMAEGFSDMFENMLDNNFTEVIGGPAGGLATDLASIFWQSGKEIIGGNTSMVTSDLKKVVRNFTGPNKLYNAWFMFTMGEYLSRNDDVVVRGLSNTDALLHTFGGQIRDANLAYTMLEVMAKDDEMLKEHGKRMGEMARKAKTLIEGGDFEGGKEIMQQIAAARAMLEPYQMRKTNKALYPQMDSLFESILNKVTTERLYGKLTEARGG
jgi:hypothetical protein